MLTLGVCAGGFHNDFCSNLSRLNQRIICLTCQTKSEQQQQLCQKDNVLGFSSDVCIFKWQPVSNSKSSNQERNCTCSSHNFWLYRTNFSFNIRRQLLEYINYVKMIYIYIVHYHMCSIMCG